MTAAAPSAVTRSRAAAWLGGRRLQIVFGVAMVAANLFGGLDVFLFLELVLPHAQHPLDSNLLALTIYLSAAVVTGTALSAYAFRPIRRSLTGPGPLSSADRRYLVRHPLRQTVINFALWLGSLPLFLSINASHGWATGAEIGTTILLGALTTCGLTYLLGERLLRPLFRFAFEEGLPPNPGIPGVKSRLLLAWVLGTGIPLLGIAMMPFDRSHPLSVPALTFLSCIGLATGALATLIAAKSVAEPVESVTDALQAVEEGRLDLRVPVYDGSQIGQLQHGFNTMVEGLRERRRLQDLFGRQVGTDVARQALERGVRLGGESVDAAVLFVDIIGSTRLAATRSAEDVVAALNRFFAVVVDVVDRCGGFVNKFEGDAALCIFGAPVPRDDAATCALTAARLLRDRLRDVAGLSAAIGVSAGTVVAGNVGTRERFEYTVIGDPVNEAARLTELAKSRPDRLVVAASVVAGATPEERAYWCLDGEVILRGRSAATGLACLRS